MDTIQSAAVAIGIFASIGAFIDFYLGKSGQKQVRESLARIWIVLDDVPVKDLAKKEAVFALQALTSMLGSSWRSPRRALVPLLIYLGYSALLPPKGAFGSQSHVLSLHHAYQIAILLATTSISIAITIAVARKISRSRFDSALASVIALAAAITLQTALILAENSYNSDSLTNLQRVVNRAAWDALLPSGYDVKITRMEIGEDVVEPNLKLTQFQEAISDTVYLVLVPLGYFDRLYRMISGQASLEDSVGLMEVCLSLTTYEYGRGGALGCTASTISYVRMLLLLLFFFVLLLRPMKTVVSTLVLRITESEKPVFTLVLGSLAAMVKAIQEAFKLF